MAIARSIIFCVLFFGTAAILLLLALPLVIFPEKYIYGFWNLFSKILDFITQKIAGIDYKIENEQNLLKEPAIYAFRHESTWETLVLIHKFQRPIFVLKKELLRIPIFAQLSRRVGTISVDRENGARALISAARKIEKSIAKGQPVIIFPEGTRAQTGEHVPIKRGIAFFYKKSNCSVVPVIHDAGKFWPRGGFLKKSGVVTVKFLDPIPPGLSQDEFMNRLNEVFYLEIEKLKA
ncbi:MAG: 1-acyl-sn-glycerol-3-phosphate acyltransferase [Holosporaceae bacterium]|jgi:1-acyl-sn-glycerol-3-phosphate acyltransferase|nr:1-acyl-sn-glycerol-3-phosphate acyltransferase [Holosporaceae bacterium]